MRVLLRRETSFSLSLSVLFSLASYERESFEMAVPGPIEGISQSDANAAKRKHAAFLSRLVLEGVFNFRSARERETPSLSRTMRVSDGRIVSEPPVFRFLFSLRITLNRSNYRQQMGGHRYHSGLSGEYILLIDCSSRRNQNVPPRKTVLR